MKRIKRVVSTVVVAVVAVVAFSGCSSTSNPPSTDTSSGAAKLGIDDSNPWKAEFVEAYENTSNPFVRAVLSDGKVTDEERAETQSKYSECLKQFGLGVKFIGKLGAEELTIIDGKAEHPNANAEADECMRSTGQDVIIQLYASSRTNPDNEDSMALSLQCLKDRGLVERGMKVDQFRKKNEDWDYVDSLGKDYEECATDPKGLMQ